MRALFGYIMLLVFLVFWGNLFPADISYGDIPGVFYVGNYDGDTITVNIPSVHPLIGENITVRVFGIDAPEIKGRCEKEKRLAVEARETLRDLLLGARNITLRDVARDKYFRILAVVVVDNVDVAEVLLSRGLAVRYYGERKNTDWCPSEKTLDKP